MIKATDRQALDKAKRASAGQLLLKCARLLDEIAVERVNRELGTPTLRPAHTKLFPHIDFEGTRISTIADRLGVTKQAVSLWIAELAELKVVEIVADPDDGRAKRVRFTRRGVQAIHHGLEVLRQIEQDLAKRVGAKAMASLRATLAELVPALEALGVQASGSINPVPHSLR